MFGVSLDRWLSIVNTIYVWAVVIAAAATFVSINLSQLISARDAEEKEALQSQVELARADTARANERAAALEKDAAQARAEQERIKSQLAWRGFSEQQKELLVRELSWIKGSVTIGYTQSDPETISYAAQLSHIFASANEAAAKKTWETMAEPRLYSDRVVYGVYIPRPENDTVNALRTVFAKAGIEFSTDDVPPNVTQVGPATFTGGPLQTQALIFIGSKRPPF